MFCYIVVKRWTGMGSTSRRTWFRVTFLDFLRGASTQYNREQGLISCLKPGHEQPAEIDVFTFACAHAKIYFLRTRLGNF